QVAHAFQAAHEDRVLQQDLLQLGDAVPDLGQGVPDHLRAAGRQVLRNATGADVAVVHPQPGDRFEDLQDLFAAVEAVRHHRGRTELVTAGADGHQVGADAVQLHHQHADEGGAFGDLLGDAQQTFHGQAVA